MTKTSKKTITVAAPKQVQTNKCTLEQFRAWLSGVEEMQEADWAPNATQWKRIRDKIDEIVETRQPFNSSAAGAPEVVREPAREIREVRPSGPSLLTPSIAAPPAAPPSFLATNDMTREGSGGARLKTPTIDTSNKPYASSLE